MQVDTKNVDLARDWMAQGLSKAYRFGFLYGRAIAKFLQYLPQIALAHLVAWKEIPGMREQDTVACVVCKVSALYRKLFKSVFFYFVLFVFIWYLGCCLLYFSVAFLLLLFCKDRKETYIDVHIWENDFCTFVIKALQSTPLGTTSNTCSKLRKKTKTKQTMCHPKCLVRGLVSFGSKST